MKRRRFVQSISLLYGSPSLFAQAIAKLDTVATDAAGKPVPRFFSAAQLAALRRLSDLVIPAGVMPDGSGAPGALEAGAPEFLDFLIGQSPQALRTLYRSGLEGLNTRAMARYGKGFAALDDEKADVLLSPLRAAWTWNPPTDPFALFLRHAKADVLMATMNSREWITAAQRNRGSGGNGTYWLPPE
jgi:hypothetical protein